MLKIKINYKIKNKKKKKFLEEVTMRLDFQLQMGVYPLFVITYN